MKHTLTTSHSDAELRTALSGPVSDRIVCRYVHPTANDGNPGATITTKSFGPDTFGRPTRRGGPPPH